MSSKTHSSKDLHLLITKYYSIDMKTFQLFLFFKLNETKELLKLTLYANN